MVRWADSKSQPVPKRRNPDAMRAMSTPSYDRAPSDELKALLSPKGFLAPLVGLTNRRVNGLELDVHLRVNDEVQIYCGLTRVLNVRRNRNLTVSVSAHQTYSRQDCARAILRRWHTDEVDEFERALDAYLDSVNVSKRHTATEGAVQSMWSRVTYPWIPFDREAVLSYSAEEGSRKAREFKQVEVAGTELEAIAESQQWAMPRAVGGEVDQIAVDMEGRLVIAELKDASASPASVFYTPFQLLHYVWEWHNALESVRSGLQNLIGARVELGLTPHAVPRLAGGIRAAVCFGRDGRSDEVKNRYDRVLGVVNRHLPPLVPPIETWTYEERPTEVQPGVPGPLPESRPRGTSFANSLQAHLEEWRQGVDGFRSRMWDHWSEGVYPAYRSYAEEVVRADSVRLHRYAAHLKSSQVFALNLFLPFRKGSLSRLSNRVSEMVGTRLSIEDVRFEWVPPGSLLGEIDGDRPVGEEPATAVDVVLWSRLADGRRAVVLLEVKLSEPDFTHCNGRTSPANQRRDVCESAGLFFEDPSTCYLRRPLRKRRDRRYWDIFALEHGSVGAAFPGADLDGPCPFSESMQQPMRNLAIARGLEQDRDSEVEKAWFELCAHDGNPDAAEHWERWKRLLPDASMAPVLSTSDVVRAGEDEGHVDWAAWMRDRYRLCPA